MDDRRNMFSRRNPGLPGSLPSSEILEFYGIKDYAGQIGGYGSSFTVHFRAKTLSDDELKSSLRDGFYIGERKSHIGDYLTYSNIPRHLKQTYPGCKVFIAPHRLAETVFQNNPCVDGIRDIPGREPTGAFREFGWGNTHQRRLRIFRIFTEEELVPELRIRAEAGKEASAWRSRLGTGKRILAVHSSGRTVGSLLGWFEWKRVFDATKDRFHWVQFHFPRDRNIPCHERLTGLTDINQTLAHLDAADLFLGPNSGPMHLHASLKKPGIILHNEITAEEIVFPILADNLALPRPVNHHFQHCYSHHTHICMTAKNRRSPSATLLHGLRYSKELLIETIRSFA